MCIEQGQPATTVVDLHFGGSRGLQAPGKMAELGGPLQAAERPHLARLCERARLQWFSRADKANQINRALCVMNASEYDAMLYLRWRQALRSRPTGVGFKQPYAAKPATVRS